MSVIENRYFLLRTKTRIPKILRENNGEYCEISHRRSLRRVYEKRLFFNKFKFEFVSFSFVHFNSCRLYRIVTFV